MNPEKFWNNNENLRSVNVTPPPIELLLSDPKNPSVWPEEISADNSFVEQMEGRKELIDRLNVILSKVHRPDITLAEMISFGQISENEVAELYISLSELLSDPDYARASLYIPFEFLPKQEMFYDSQLNQAAKNFTEAYMQAWYSLLNIHDVRANFVDGDVLEVEMRTEDLPRVVKAAHLIPELIEHGMLTTDDTLELIESSEDETLRRSITDTLPVLHDLGFISPENLSRLQSSKDDFVRDVANKIISYQSETAIEDAMQPVSFLDIKEKLQIEFTHADSAEHEELISEKRTKWLKEKNKNEVIDSLSDEICSVILNRKLEQSEIEEIIFPDADIFTQQTFIEGIRKAVESAHSNNAVLAENLYEQHKDILLTLWQRKSPEIKDILSKLFCRLYRLNVVEIEQLNELGIIAPDLSEPFSKNLRSMEIETEKIKKIINKIETDPLLSEFIYPVVIIYGSKLKGYGSENADIDVAIMIKPQTSFDKRGDIREKLKSVFGDEQIDGIVTEFWLEETDSGLSVRNFSESDPELGDKSWTHVLFGGVWEGNEDTISELRTKLLAPYFSETDEIIHGHKARELYIEELERDTLQYRLMHKGYERFYPSYNTMKTFHSDEIDGKSIFWDSGYRDAAIKLFASRVFLPKISPKV